MSYPPQSIESDLIRAVAFFADQEKVMRGWPHTIFLYTTDAPKGIRDSLAILKHCFPIGMPRIVMHQRQPRMQYPIAISRPKNMDLFDFNHDGEVSDLERIIGLAAVLSETNPDVEISVNVGEDEDYESMTHDELEERLDELRAQRGTLECEEPDDLDSEAYEEWEEQCG